MKKSSGKISSDSQPMSESLWRRLHEGAFILVTALSLFLIISLWTYHTADPGWSHSSPKAVIYNAAGVLGAWFADVCYYFFGYVAYLFPVVISYGAFQLCKGRLYPRSFHRGLWSLRILGFMSALLAGCGLVALHLRVGDPHLPTGVGGISGQLMASQALRTLGNTGSTLTLTALFLVGITLTTGLSWFGIVDRLSRLFLEKMRFFREINFKKYLDFKALQQWVSASKTKQSPLLGFKKEPMVASMAPMLRIPPGPEPKIVASTMRRTPPIVSTTTIVMAESSETALPSVTLLENAHHLDVMSQRPQDELARLSVEVESKLFEFGVQARVVSILPGPVITQFELELAPGIKVSKITGLAKDLARALSVNRVRVVEVIPGKSVVGLEIPNENREMVLLREMLESTEYVESASLLTLALGKDISGKPVVVNLSKMPHLLVAGTTGSGKSIGLNVMLLSLLYKATPQDVRLILIDPKMLELSIYEGIPHLLTPVVTDMKEAANALRWCVAEMEHRYQLMSALGVRNVLGFNKKIEEAEARQQPIFDPFYSPESGEAQSVLKSLPYIVVIIDEFADMMMVVGKKVEELIARIAQKARAAGIHLILATQRPSVDVITGLIKANVPTRIAFQVSSRIDSRTILDQQGAEQLLGHGDMLYLAPGAGIPIRIHGAFVSDEEVHAVVHALKALASSEDRMDVLDPATGPRRGMGASAMGLNAEEGGEQDSCYDEAVQIVCESGRASISYLQRRLKIGYNRAARLIETMEVAGIVSPLQSNGSREVLVRSESE